MLEIRKKLPFSFSDPVSQDTFFLSMDTTGFQAEVSAISMIGIACPSEDGIMLHQWFNDTGRDQKEILAAFLEEIRSMQTVITYYGNRFALPFIEKKCQEYQLSDTLTSMRSRDYYDILHPLRTILGLSSCRQSSVETAFGCKRTSKLSGKKLVTAYQNYVKDPSPERLDALLLHNQESLEVLLALVPVFSYESLFNHSFSDCSIRSVESDEITFSFRLPSAVIKPVQYATSDYALTIHDRIGLLTLPLDDQEQFKHYFPDPKDYYYLPVEDRAIHKSLASFVSKEYKRKADLTTCYEKLSASHPAFSHPQSLHQLIADTIIHLIRTS